MTALSKIWTEIRKALLFVFAGLSLSQAQFDIPYGKVLKDSVEWYCCFTAFDNRFYHEDENHFELKDYNPEAWACCFIEPSLRRYEILQIQAKIRNDSLDRVERA